VGPAEGVDVEAIQALLAERADAKKARDFDAADELQAQLKEMGVDMDDRKRTWGLAKAPNGGIEGYALEGNVPEGVDEENLKVIFAKRADAKRARDFETADELQAQLKEMGVFVDDRTKTWGAAGAPDGGYVLQGRPPAGVDVADVNARLARRRDAKKATDFALADEIQDELTALGVRVFDSKRTWSAMRGEPKAFSLKGPPPEGVDVAEVEAMLAKRVTAKKARDYEMSDALQAELLQMGVYVNDKQRTWEAKRA